MQNLPHFVVVLQFPRIHLKCCFVNTILPLQSSHQIIPSLQFLLKLIFTLLKFLLVWYTNKIQFFCLFMKFQGWFQWDRTRNQLGHHLWDISGWSMSRHLLLFEPFPSCDGCKTLFVPFRGSISGRPEVLLFSFCSVKYLLYAFQGSRCSCWRPLSWNEHQLLINFLKQLESRHLSRP